MSALFSLLGNTRVLSILVVVITALMLTVPPFCGITEEQMHEMAFIFGLVFTLAELGLVLLIMSYRNPHKLPCGFCCLTRWIGCLILVVGILTALVELRIAGYGLVAISHITTQFDEVVHYLIRLIRLWRATR